MVLNFDERIEERSRGFIGRQWVFEAINGWLESWPAKKRNERFFLIQGEPGSGKSSIAAQLVQISRQVVLPPDSCPHLRPDFLTAIHFCDRTDSLHLDPLTFVNSLAMQLAERYAEFGESLVASGGNRVKIQVEQDIAVVNEGGQAIGVRIEHLELGGLSAENAFTLSITTPLLNLAARGFNEPMLILVDGLDESLLYTGTPTIPTLLQRLGALPDNVRLICTTGPQPSITDPLVGQMYRFVMSAPEFRDEVDADITAYIERAAQQYPQLTAHIPQPQLTERIRALADGNFLYLSQLLPLMAKIEEMTVTDLDEIEPGLGPLYRSYLREFEADWEDSGKKIFGTLAVARAPLSVEQLKDITGIPGVSSVLATVRPLLDADDEAPASKRVYALYHRSFADFLLDQDDAEEYWCKADDQHQRIADYYISEYDGYWNEADDYGLRYVVTHLGLATLAQRNPSAGTRQLLTLLQPNSLEAAHRARFDDFSGLQADFRLALQCALQGRRQEMLPLLVQASRDLLHFRRRVLNPATVFDLARTGNVGAAVRRLSLFSADTHWIAVTKLLIAWLAHERGPDEAKTLLDQMADESYIWPYEKLRNLVTRQIVTGEPAPESESELPPAPPDVAIDAIMARFDSEYDSEGIGNFTLGSFQNDSSPAILSAIYKINESGSALNIEDPTSAEPMYLALQDGPPLVAYAKEDPEQGDARVEQYLAILGANQYAFYRNRSLWIFMEALLRHPDPAWVQRMCVTASQYALSGTTAAFEGAALEAQWALMKSGKPVEADEVEQHVKSALQTIYDNDGNQTRDMWGIHKQTMLALVEALALLPDTEQTIKSLLKRARKTKGFAGFQATARLCEAETVYIVTGEIDGRVRDALDQARSSAHNIQDPVFCARSTARETALRELWWQPLPNIAETIEEFISEPDHPKFLARHRIGENYSLRHDTANKMPLPFVMLNAHSLRDLAPVYESSPEELSRLNNLDEGERLDDGTLIVIPDPAFRYWLARRFAAELLVNPQELPYEQRSTLMRQLVSIVADDASALDTLLARVLLLSANESVSASVLEELATVLTVAAAPPK